MIFLVKVFGSDESNILLLYAIFTLFWQRQLEAPVQNEVEDAGEIRGYVAILSTLIVFLVLLPMP